VRSLGDKNWTESDIAFMRSMGNDRVKMIYEYKLPSTGITLTSNSQLKRFIMAKYLFKKYAFQVEFLERKASSNKRTREEFDLMHFTIPEEDWLAGTPSKPPPRARKLSKQSLKKEVLELYDTPTKPRRLSASMTQTPSVMLPTFHAAASQGRVSKSWTDDDLSTWDPFSVDQECRPRSPKKNKTEILALYASCT